MKNFEILNINPNQWKPCCKYRLVGILPVINKSGGIPTLWNNQERIQVQLCCNNDYMFCKSSPGLLFWWKQFYPGSNLHIIIDPTLHGSLVPPPSINVTLTLWSNNFRPVLNLFAMSSNCFWKLQEVRIIKCLMTNPCWEFRPFIAHLV